MSKKLTREEQNSLKQRIKHKRACRFIEKFINNGMRDVRQAIIDDVSKRILEEHDAIKDVTAFTR